MKKVIIAFALIGMLACNALSSPGTSVPTSSAGGEPGGNQPGGNEDIPTATPGLGDVTSSTSIWSVAISDKDPDANPYNVSLVGTSLGMAPAQDILGYRPYYVRDGVVYYSDAGQQPTAADLRRGKVLWQSDVQGTVMGVANSTILVYRDDNRIYALDKKSGKEVWKVIVASLVPAEQKLTPFAYILPGQNDITVPMKALCSSGFDEWNVRYLHINETNGDTNLTDCGIARDLDTPYLISSGIVVTEDLLSQYGMTCLNGQRGVAGIDPVNGAQKWVIYPGDPYQCLVIHDADSHGGVLYAELVWSVIGGARNDLLAIDPTSGNLMWGDALLAKNGLIGDQPPYGQFTVAGDYIYYSTLDTIYVFQKASGNLLNKFPQDRQFKSFVSTAGDLVVSYPDLGTTKGIDPANGQDTWSNDDLVLTETLPFTAGILVMHDENTKEAFGLDPKTGKTLWRETLDGFPGNDAVFFTNHFTNYQGAVLYKGMKNTELYSLDPKSGENRLLMDVTQDAITIEPMSGGQWLVHFAGELDLVGLR